MNFVLGRCVVQQQATGFEAVIQVPKHRHLLPVLMSWPPAVDAEKHRLPVGSMSSLHACWTCFGHS